MTLKVPGTILARSENLDPLCGPTMENARIFNTHHGSKRPIMDPLNHAQNCTKFKMSRIWFFICISIIPLGHKKINHTFKKIGFCYIETKNDNDINPIGPGIFFLHLRPGGIKITHPPSCKMLFYAINHSFFMLNRNSIWFQLSLEIYNVSVGQNLKFWYFFINFWP